MFNYKNIEICPIEIKYSMNEKGYINYTSYICDDGKLYILFKYNTDYDFISSNISINKNYLITRMKVGYLYILTNLVKIL